MHALIHGANEKKVVRYLFRFAVRENWGGNFLKMELGKYWFGKGDCVSEQQEGGSSEQASCAKQGHGGNSQSSKPAGQFGNQLFKFSILNLGVKMRDLRFAVRRFVQSFGPNKDDVVYPRGVLEDLCTKVVDEDTGFELFDSAVEELLKLMEKNPSSSFASGLVDVWRLRNVTLV